MNDLPEINPACMRIVECPNNEVWKLNDEVFYIPDRRRFTVKELPPIGGYHRCGRVGRVLMPPHRGDRRAVVWNPK